MENPQELIGRKVRGFKFKGRKGCTFNANMIDVVGLKGEIESYERGLNSFRVRFSDMMSWAYPADQIEAHLVEEQNETPTFTKEDLKSFYNIGFANGVDNQNKSSCLEFEKEFNKRFNPTKEEQLTAILGSSEKVSEIMKLFNDKK
jgi:hypothetical protein